MSHPLSAPALGALLVAAAAFGVHLGESAIAEIDPIHFSGPALHPRDRGAAIDPNRVRAAEPSYASFYGWEEGNEARDANCMDCGALAARDEYAVDPYAYEAPVEHDRAYRQALAAADAVEEAEAWAEDAPDEAEHAVASVDWGRVARYASYPITVEEAEPAAEFESDDPYPAGGL